MLTNDEIDDIRAALAGVARALPEYRERRAQRVMLGAVAKAFAAGATAAKSDSGDERPGSRNAVVEASTGTGKSCAALPAIVIAKRRGKKVIISSSTVALQEQLTLKDLPTMQAAFPYAFTFAVAKGRGRYVCKDKLVERASDYEVETRQGKVIPIRPQSGTDGKFAAELVKQLESGVWDGEYDSLPNRVDEATWEQLTTDRHGCSGRTCLHFNHCAYYQARQRVKAADVVVTNHSLLLASISVPEEANLLPALENSLLIIDEAHHLPAKAVQQFAVKHTLRGTQQWLDDIESAVERSVHVCNLDRATTKEAAALADRIGGAMRLFARTLDEEPTFKRKGLLRFTGTAVPLWVADLGRGLQADAAALTDILAKCRDEVKAANGIDRQTAQRLIAKLGTPMGKLQSVVGAWDVLLNDDADAPAARWVEATEGRGGRTDYAICAAPVSAAAKLASMLWDRACATVSLSATLTGCGSFSLYLEESGLARLGTPTLKQLPSPFDYANRAALIVPPMKSDPRNAEAHTDEVVAMLPRLVTSLGTLVLWTSQKQMRAVHERLPVTVRAKVLMQGEMGKAQIMATHRERVQRGEQSVIFGLQAYAEGVDLAGELLTHVVLTRIPFAVPDTPLEEARAEWIESQGRSSFEEYTLPQTGMKLAQAVGRLLRRETDWGAVTVLDKRLVTSRWGKRLIGGLPPFRLVVGPGWRSELPGEALKERQQRAA